MATQFSMLGIMNAALLAQGQEEVVNENDGSLEWRLLFRNWPGIVEAELEDGNYHFTKQEAALITRAPGKFGFDDAFLVPSAALHVRHLWVVNQGNRITVDWIQDGTYVHLDSPTGCTIEYLVADNPELWSANFSRGVQKKLEALISTAVREESSEARALEQEAEMYFQRARTNSSKARRARTPYARGPIASSRFRTRSRQSGV